jgi:hypothetical protein
MREALVLFTAGEKQSFERKGSEGFPNHAPVQFPHVLRGYDEDFTGRFARQRNDAGQSRDTASFHHN